MLNGFFDAMVAVLLQSASLTDEARPFIGVVAALAAAVVAAYAGWQLTDRVVAWRRRAD